MILRDKDENSSQEKEASESDENLKIEKKENLVKQKAWEKSVPSHKVIQQGKHIENTLENILLVEQPSLTSCKGTLASMSKKEESLKEACIDYFSSCLIITQR